MIDNSSSNPGVHSSSHGVHDVPSTGESNSTKMDRKMLLLFSAMYTFLLGGAAFGWGPMQLMLEESGSYHSLCANADDDAQVCPAQKARLLNM